MNRIVILIVAAFGVIGSSWVSALEGSLPTEQDVVLVIGYNNTRVNDVRKIRGIAKERLNAATVLCKKSPTQEDRLAADFVIDTDLFADEALVDNVLRECGQLMVHPVAILPFSDQGTQLGACLANRLGLPGADPQRVRAGLDKSTFRRMEREAESRPYGYRPLFSTVIHSKEELLDVITARPNGVFMKPCQEGNNRGCTAVHSLEECDGAWAFVEAYKKGGILIEELVLGAQEYSCDCSGSSRWVTEKATSCGVSGKYRGEIQAIIPAPLSPAETQARVAVGRFMADVSGYRVGAYHNEIFYKSEAEVMAVEPNLRPAGGRFWDIAQLAFDNFNPWAEWIETMAGRRSPHDEGELVRNFYAGMRYVAASEDGQIAALPSISLPEQVVELVWTKKVGDRVVADQRDNSDFVGFIIVKDKDYERVDAILKTWTQKLSENIILK
ncbi:MAG: biotin carboxylase [Chlamydiia bacterium]